MNPYVYVGNDPVNWVDPYGEEMMFPGMLPMLPPIMPGLSGGVPNIHMLSIPNVPDPGNSGGESETCKINSHKPDGSKKKETGTRVPGSEETHTDHPHAPYKDGHKHWTEIHVDPKTGKKRAVKRTGPLNP